MVRSLRIGAFLVLSLIAMTSALAAAALEVGSDLLVSASVAGATSAGSSMARTAWTHLAEGLECGRFATEFSGLGGDETVVVLRADPALWSLDMLCASEDSQLSRFSTRQWCERAGLVAAINAGMYAPDFLTHVGYCSVRNHVNNASENEYQSVAAFCPRREDLPLFRIFDLDEPGVTIESIRADYACVSQNLRLIKRPRENRWSQQPKRWSEAALGEDASGRILFIFSRTAYSMHDLIRILLSLPLDLVCAQHLEGGPEAQMYIGIGGFEAELIGSYETSYHESDDRLQATLLPVVFGLRGRQGADGGDPPAAGSAPRHR
jgi:hypothetical protein